MKKPMGFAQKMTKQGGLAPKKIEFAKVWAISKARGVKTVVFHESWGLEIISFAFVLMVLEKVVERSEVFGTVAS